MQMISEYKFVSSSKLHDYLLTSFIQRSEYVSPLHEAVSFGNLCHKAFSKKNQIHSNL